MFGNRGDFARVFHSTLHTRLRTHDASGVPRALSFEWREWETPQARTRALEDVKSDDGAPRAAKNRGDGACRHFVIPGRAFFARARNLCSSQTQNMRRDGFRVRSFHSRPGMTRRHVRPGNDERKAYVIPGCPKGPTRNLDSASTQRFRARSQKPAPRNDGGKTV